MTSQSHRPYQLGYWWINVFQDMKTIKCMYKLLITDINTTMITSLSDWLSFSTCNSCQLIQAETAFVSHNTDKYHPIWLRFGVSSADSPSTLTGHCKKDSHASQQSFWAYLVPQTISSFLTLVDLKTFQSAERKVVMDAVESKGVLINASTSTKNEIFYEVYYNITTRISSFSNDIITGVKIVGQKGEITSSKLYTTTLDDKV